MTTRKNLIVVGDRACGKTCLLNAFRFGRFLEEHLPTVFDDQVGGIEINGKKIELSLWNTAGREIYDNVRPSMYQDVNIVVICYAINSLRNLENVTNKWAVEVNQFCPNVPIILVGTKSDLRNDQNKIKELINPIEARVVAEKIGAVAYMECSAKTMVGVSDVFETATKAVLHTKKKKREKCTLL